jgi:hypothetical protein
VSRPHKGADFFISGYPSTLAVPEKTAVRGVLLTLETWQIPIVLNLPFRCRRHFTSPDLNLGETSIDEQLNPGDVAGVVGKEKHTAALAISPGVPNQPS